MALLMSVVPGLGRLSKGDCKSEDSLNYRDPQENEISG